MAEFVSVDRVVWIRQIPMTFRVWLGGPRHSVSRSFIRGVGPWNGGAGPFGSGVHVSISAAPIEVWIGLTLSGGNVLRSKRVVCGRPSFRQRCVGNGRRRWCSGVGKGGLVVRILARPPVSADQAEAGAVFARPKITAFDFAGLAPVAGLSDSGAFLPAVGLGSSGRVFYCVGAIPLARG